MRLSLDRLRCDSAAPDQPREGPLFKASHRRGTYHIREVTRQPALEQEASVCSPVGSLTTGLDRCRITDGTGDPTGLLSKVITFAGGREPLFATPTFGNPANPVSLHLCHDESGDFYKVLDKSIFNPAAPGRPHHDAYRLDPLPGREGQSAALGDIITVGLGRAVGGRILHRHRAGAGGRQRDPEVGGPGAAMALRQGDIGDGEYRAIVIEDGALALGVRQVGARGLGEIDEPRI